MKGRTVTELLAAKSELMSELAIVNGELQDAQFDLLQNLSEAGFTVDDLIALGINRKLVSIFEECKRTGQFS